MESNKDNTIKEITKIECLRLNVDFEYSMKIPDEFIIIFLKVTNDNEQKALRLLKNYIKFRRNFADGIKVKKIDITNVLASNYAKWEGLNKSGFPCIFIKSKNLIKNEHSPDSLAKLFIYLFDKGKKIMDKHNVSKFCCIADRDDYDKEKNHVPEFGDKLRPFFDSLSPIILETFDKAYIINISWFWRTMFEIAKKFINPEMLSKVLMLASLDDLFQYFDKENLPDGLKSI